MLAEGWACGLWCVLLCGFLDIFSAGGSARQPQRTEPCQCVCGQPWACPWPLYDQMQPLQCAAGVAGWRLGADGGLGRCIVVCVVVRVSGNFQCRGCCSPTKLHRALPVCVWPALGMSWATTRSNAVSAVCSRSGWVEDGCWWWRAGQVVCVMCSCAGFWRFSMQEALLANHSAHSPANLCVPCPGYVLGHCKVKCRLCSVQQVRLGRGSVLAEGWAGGGLW